MQNEPALQPHPQTKPQGCQRGCMTAFAIVIVLMVLLWVIGNNELKRDTYPDRAPSSTGGERTEPGYDANAPLLPRDKNDVEPLYNEVERRKKEQGISDEEAVRQIIEEQERAKQKK
jgi:hypothetical protein